MFSQVVTPVLERDEAASPTRIALNCFPIQNRTAFSRAEREGKTTSFVRTFFLQCVCKDTHGSSAVEFALLTPFFLLLILGSLAYGIYFGAAHSVQQLAADAARAAVSGLTDSERTALAEHFISANGSGYVFIDPSRLTIDAAPSAADPDQFLVRLSFDANHLPIWNLYPPIPLPRRSIVFASTIRKGGV